MWNTLLYYKGHIAFLLSWALTTCLMSQILYIFRGCVTLTLPFLSSMSGLGRRAFSLTEPSLKISPKPTPLIFLGWATTPFPEAGWGDVGVEPLSIPLPSAGEIKQGEMGGDLISVQSYCFASCCNTLYRILELILNKTFSLQDTRRCSNCEFIKLPSSSF